MLSIRKPSNAVENVSTFTALSVTTRWAPATARSSSAVTSPPPNYHTDYSRGFERRGIKVLLRDVPVGYYFEVISRGYGGMPDYASQIPPDDRWKIIAYVRALQLSQWAPLKDLSENERDKAQKELQLEEERP